MSSQVTMPKEGCYLVHFTPVPAFDGIEDFDGTLRVEQSGQKIVASGDLYVRKSNGRSAPNPGEGIPVFPLDDYRFYLRIAEIGPKFDTPNSFKVRFEPLEFHRPEDRFIECGAFSADLTKNTAPANYPAGADYYTGLVTDEEEGRVVGNFTVGWVSPRLRRAEVEIDSVAGSGAPFFSGSDQNWENVFKAVNWEMKASRSDTGIVEPHADGVWTQGELHEQMLHSRINTVNLDKEWHYYLLCVRQIADRERGVMFDASGTDSNNMPREGAALESDWEVPAAPEWGGRPAGTLFKDVPQAYFRTAVHEVGHAMGLAHNAGDNGFMNTTDVLVQNLFTEGKKFPDDIQYLFAPDDQNRLRHGPDICVRPGGTAWVDGNSLFPRTTGLGDSAAVLASQEFDLAVSAPLVDKQPEKAEGPQVTGVPIGAPVRIKFTLTNVTAKRLKVPANLSLKSGTVDGKVVDPKGKVRAFLPLIKCVDEGSLRDLDPGQSMSEWITLLRGPDGPLFPEPGFYRVIVQISWDDCPDDHKREFVEQLVRAGANPAEAAKLAAKYACHSSDSVKAYSVKGETSLRITKPFKDDENHAKIAERILKTPDTLLSLAIGGDHLVEGNEAIAAAVNNPAYEVLKPHCAIIEAKRLAQRHRARAANIVAACKLIDEKTVLSVSECNRMLELIARAIQSEPEKAKHEDVQRVVLVLIVKLHSLGADAQTLKFISQLPEVMFSSEQTARSLDELTRSVEEKAKHPDFELFLEKITKSDLVQKASKTANKIFSDLLDFWQKR